MAASNGRKSSSSNRKTTRSTAAKASARKKKAEAARAAQDSAMFHEIGLIVLFAAMVFFFCCNFGIIGPVGNAVSGVLFGVFGLCAYVLPVLLFLAVAFWFANVGNPGAVRKLTAGFVLFLMAGVVCDLLAKGAAGMEEYSVATLYETCRETRKGGGVLSGSLSFFLQGYLETIGTVLVVLLCTVVSIILLTEKSLLGSVKRGGSRVRELSRGDMERRREMAEARRLEQEEKALRRQEMAEARRMQEEEEAARRREETGKRRQAQEEQRARKAEERRLKSEEKENAKILRADRKGGVSLDTLLIGPKDRNSYRNDMHEIILSEEELGIEPQQEAMPGEAAPAQTDEIRIPGGKKGNPDRLAASKTAAGQRDTAQEASVRKTAGQSKTAQEAGRPKTAGQSEAVQEPNNTNAAAEDAAQQPYIRIHKAAADVTVESTPGPEPLSGSRNPDSEAESAYAARLRAMQRKTVVPFSGRTAQSVNADMPEAENAFVKNAYTDALPVTQAESDSALFEPEGERHIAFSDSEEERYTALSGSEAGRHTALSALETEPNTDLAASKAEQISGSDFRVRSEQPQGRPVSLNYGDLNSDRNRQNGYETVSAAPVSASGPMPGTAQPVGSNREAGVTETNPQSAASNAGKVRPAAVLPQNTQGSGSGENGRIAPEIVEPKKYLFPSLSLLQKGTVSTGDSERELRETALHLQQTLSTFGVKVTITDISQGPSVTRYELQPEQGVKVSKIVGLADDIKLNLAAMDIRIEAPIPGKAAIGIEVPNKETMTVGLRDLLETKTFREFQSNLAFAVGKDIAGQVVVSDIAKMPHMLIAGATGSGKSVCINTLIMSILYKAHPDDVKLIMVDPKVVELSVYNGIPHLLVPVVTDPKKASGALHWGVAEMDDRYRKFAEFGARNLKEYNKKVEALQKKGEEKAPEKLPQIVIIVDELADLMMVCPGEVEASICRLAQLARACGIHLVIATQRPSVDVITGLIKANMPSRVAFSVSSGVDSRTILDMVGAEKLLGKGDMLFYPQGYPKPARVQGAFVSDDEVSNVVDFLKNQRLGNTYSADIEAKMESIGNSTSSGSDEKASGGSNVDELFEKAGRLIIDKDKASIGMLQRALQIGFNRAARIMDQLCQYGVVGEEEGTKPRKILMSPEQFEQLLEEVA